jgi:hypothetical protein
MINIIQAVNYYENDIYQAIELPYDSTSLCMICIVLKDLNALPNKVINSTLLDEAVRKFTFQEVYVQIPRFDVESELISLKKLIPRGAKGQVSDILQRVAFGCYEQVSCPTPPEPGVEIPEYGLRFIADHPFFFCVRDSDSGLVVTFGYIGRPIAIDLEPLTPQERERQFLARIKGEDNDLDDGVLWNLVEHLGDPVEEVPDVVLPKDEGIEIRDLHREMVNTPVEEGHSDLWEFVYCDGMRPADPKEMEEMFGMQSKNRVTYSKFTTWGNVEFHPPPQRTDLYRPPTKFKSPHRFPMNLKH